jgi:hypothetical protein
MRFPKAARQEVSLNASTEHRGDFNLVGKFKVAVITCLLALAVLGFAITGNATTVAANSCSLADAQTAVTSAGRGGTVTIPAGNCTWGSTLTLTYGITLAGAGVDTTVITSSGGVTLISVIPDLTAIANSQSAKITGFTFNGAGTAQTLINIQGASGITGTIPYRNIIIGDNKFQNNSPTSSTLLGAVIQANADSDGQLRGVIYHNIFDRCNIILHIFSNDDTREWANTAFNQLTFGTSDNLYFEDNTILFSSSYSGDNPGWIETGQGGRLVGRYNTWNMTNATTPQEIWDIHGFQNWTGSTNSGQTSTMVVEYYGNTLTNMGQYRWINHRGSWGLFFNNILTGSGGNSIDIYGMSTPASCPSDISPTPTNYNPTVNNTYFFNNTQNGSVVAASMLSSGNPTHCTVSENSNWWNYNAACTISSCSSGVGRGTTAPTGTCTTGVGYWVASTATPTASSSVTQAGQFYKCTSTNTWTPYYTPYTYPHPLRSSNAAPAPPTNLKAVVQ